MLLDAAPLSEVWSLPATGGRPRSRRAPSKSKRGSKGPRRTQAQLEAFEAEAAEVVTTTRVLESRKARCNDPVCDLTYKGYSPDILAAMDEETDVTPPVRSVDTASPFHVRPMTEGFSPGQGALMASFPAAEVDFYADDGSDGADTDEEEDCPALAGGGAQGGAAVKAAAAAAEAAPSSAAPAGGEGGAALLTGDMEALPNIGLYLLSGLFLIIILEQFIQLGARLSRVGAA